jgi:hypothetical protein
MSCVSVVPDSMVAAAAELEHIASTLDEAHRLAAPAILTMAPAGADEVSADIAQLFSAHAQDYQAVAREAAAFHERFVQNMSASAVSYASADDLIALLLRGLDAEVSYYTTAALDLGTIIVLFPLQALLLIVIPPLWILLPALALTQISALATDVIFRRPISYPYMVKT